MLRHFQGWDLSLLAGGQGTEAADESKDKLSDNSQKMSKIYSAILAVHLVWKAYVD